MAFKKRNSSSNSSAQANQIRQLQAQVAASKSSEAQTEKGRVARTEDIKAGREFGKEVLGPEGLGRLGSDAEVSDALSRKKAIADQGLSRQEVAAERAQATRSIDSSTQTSQRQLQAQLARSGVKGAVAGNKLLGAQAAGMQQKADLSQNLFLKSEQIKREGLKDYSSALGETKTFDLGQAAKEKDIELQAGLGMAQIGSSERTAQFAAEKSKESSVASARASRPSCFTGNTVLELEENECIEFKDLQPGMMLKDNNLVLGVSKHLAIDDLYYYKGTKVTGSHFVLENSKFKKVKDCSSSVKIEHEVNELYVYNIITSSGLVEINGVIFSDWNDDELEETYGIIQEVREREVQ